MAKQLSKRYGSGPGSIGYEWGESWLRAAKVYDGYVVFDCSGYAPLNAGQCRTLAKWLNRQADKMETKP